MNNASAEVLQQTQELALKYLDDAILAGANELAQLGPGLTVDTVYSEKLVKKLESLPDDAPAALLDAINKDMEVLATKVFMTTVRIEALMEAIPELTKSRAAALKAMEKKVAQ